MPAHIRVFDNAVPKDFCESLIARFEADKRVAPDPQPDYSTRHYLSASRCPDWAIVNMKLCRYVNDFTSQYFAREGRLEEGTHQEWIDDGYVISRYDIGDTLALHADGQCATDGANGLRFATFLLYLNDVPEGGETCFPLQDIKIKPVAGRVVMFPVGFTHPHEVVAAKSKRYIMQTWITDPNLIVVRREPSE